MPDAKTSQAKSDFSHLNHCGQETWFRFRNSRGLTLMEVLVVLIVIGLLSAGVKPMVQSFSSLYNQRIAISTIKQTLLTARAHAMANPTLHCGVYFEWGAENSKVLMFEDTHNPSAYSFDSTQDKRYRSPLILPKATKVIKPRSQTGYPDAIIFRGDGSAYLTGRVVVETGFRKDTVEVLASTGRIKVWR